MKLVAIIPIMMIALGVVGWGWVIGTTTSVNVAVGVPRPYKLTLLITADSPWNATTGGPRYWVVTPQGLESSANITLPVDTAIQLTIIDQDGSTPVTAPYSYVEGTITNVITITNGTTGVTKAVNSLDNDTQVGHTFSIPQLNLNIPVGAHVTETAEFTLTQRGTFTWLCEVPCGFGPTGRAGPMSGPGWMRGTVTVQ
ncbi:MAG: hypothetical protein JRM74_02925 [Nitrososphaerota archaeon]|jgi:hypothetical protein|nr:hypothetical protein [Nitrososphaerota archaeon]MDG6959204.1 hypothetical protein [Nitrososphaerota archaeon]MDG6965302.1 hypothetical protein [Nitrososphaerota archaeon]MDG6968757.1 hypothetical protein [Nitrososphaerota archaeon]MDG6972669.1 hypothetical protein [Nitrososphaerota archaeon]